MQILDKSYFADCSSNGCYGNRIFTSFCWCGFLRRRNGSSRFWFCQQLDTWNCNPCKLHFIQYTCKRLFKTAFCFIRTCCGIYCGTLYGNGGFSALHDVDIIALPHFMPFKIEFNANAIFSFILIFLVSATETIGDTSALASSGLGRDVTEKKPQVPLPVTVCKCTLFNFRMYADYLFQPECRTCCNDKGCKQICHFYRSDNHGSGGIFPAVGSLLATLPSAVLGGCTIMMFGTIVVSGVQMIGKCGYTQRNITIAALSLSIGLGFTQCPDLFNIFLIL